LTSLIKRLFNQGVMLARHMKISKRNNPLNPQPLVEKYGTDSVRAYLMFLGPWDREEIGLIQNKWYL